MIPVESVPLLVTIDSGTGYHAKEGANCIFRGTHRRDNLGKCAEGGHAACILAHVAALKCWPDVAPDSAQGIDRNSDEPFAPLRFRQYRRTYHQRPSKRVQFFVIGAAVTKAECDLYGLKGKGPLLQRLIPCNTNSERTRQTVRDWLFVCDGFHSCRMVAGSRLPRRVLDVRNDHVRVYESIGESDLYASLSHRWGTSETMLCTTTANIAGFQDHIPWDSLPRNFQDAVTFVRNIGLSYIWIDSLCIIQDSAIDWQEQSAQMAAIYQNAYVTLAAAVTAQPSDGLFTKNGNQKHWAYQTPAVIQYAGGEYPVYARLELEHTSSYLPLYERGWVYQERLLSPHIVHFVGEELIWECREFQDCECGSSDVKTALDRSMIPIEPADTMSDATYAMWRTLVSNYSELNLTYESDALPALSGLTGAFSRLSGSTQYAAGNWRTPRFVSDLLWYRVHVRPQPPGADVAVKPWRAPSCSWVSPRFGPGKVRFAPYTESMCEVRELATTLSGANPYGQLDTVYIRVAARGITTVLQPPANIHDPSVTIAGRRMSASMGSHPSIELSGIDGVMPEIFGLHNRDLYKDRLPLEVKILQLARYVEGRQQVRYYLIIAPDADGKGQWERVGVMAVPEHQGIYEGQHGDHTEEQKEEGFERELEGNRGVLRTFEEAPSGSFERRIFAQSRLS